MSGTSNIEWTDATWNPIVGCSVLSPGCTNCYAMKDAWRKHHIPAMPHYDGLTKKVNGNPVWTGKVAVAPDHILTAPLRWRKPKRIFVNSMGDLFHESISDEAIDRVFAVMALCPQHTFQVLTKRAERMRDYLLVPTRHNSIELAAETVKRGPEWIGGKHILPRLPLRNVWLGVSAERQQEADERIPQLLQTPAAIRFVSAEPLLGPIDLRRVRGGTLHALDGIDFEAIGDIRDAGILAKTQRPAKLDWVIIGGESGPKARDNWIPNVRALIKQCKSGGVAVFNKQLGSNVQDRDDAGFDGCDPTEWPAMDYGRIEHSPNGCLDEGYQGAPVRVRLKDRKGGDWSEWPEDLRVREFPQVRG